MWVSRLLEQKEVVGSSSYGAIVKDEMCDTHLKLMEIGAIGPDFAFLAKGNVVEKSSDVVSIVEQKLDSFMVDAMAKVAARAAKECVRHFGSLANLANKGGAIWREGKAMHEDMRVIYEATNALSLKVVEDFIYRSWDEYGVDRVSFLPSGVFLVRFRKKKDMDSVLHHGHFLFENKPIIVRPWSPSIPLTKAKVDVVSVWVRLLDLPLKFWGNCIPRISGLIGDYVRYDGPTEEHTRLAYARVLVDAPFGRSLPTTVKFLHEHGEVVTLKVESEWNPILCKDCGGIGHSEQMCKKVKSKVQSKRQPKSRTTQQWQPKVQCTKPVPPKVAMAKSVSPKVVTPRVVVPAPKKIIQSTPLNKPKTPAVQGMGTGSHKPNTPTRPIIRLSRQELIDHGSNSTFFGQYSFMEALNNATPRVGIGTRSHHDIGLFGLLETKVKPSSLNMVRDNLCVGWCVLTNSQWHKGGRVWLLWKPHLYHIYFMEYNAKFIHVKVKELDYGGSFYLTMVYAFNDLQDMKGLWNRLTHFKSLINGPWIVCGDFNTVLSPCERLGGLSTDEEIADFQDCVDCCNLVDIAATGSYFTWNKKQEAATRVYIRLDRALENHEWVNERADYYAHFHVEGYFDHTPCIIQRQSLKHQRKNCFKYFNIWSGVELFIPTVQKIWEKCISGTPMFQIAQKLRMLKNPLKALNRDLFGDVENNCMRAWKHLEYVHTQLKSDPTNSDLIGIELVALKDYQELQTACNSFLVQKSKAVWLADGDSNTKLFHSYLKARQARNKVLQITNVEGHCCTEPDDIQQAFLTFYQQLLVTNEEIKDALFSIPNHKAPGPDGFSRAFFKDPWEIIGVDICKAISDFFTYGRLLKQINHTLVTLIPKVSLPENVTQFRPIACCNVLYKVISNLLCARLAKILHHIISPNQGGFIQGRNIIENILVCQDIFRLYNRTSVSPRCLIKVDLKKAYD
ncbi:uncharacterized protein LOC141637289 [Silene latifolia]|uniref:uncharacterized protein LOC141637289 n=1 Tax=Silene latifolia TaxID=37657 RepID=UPI003D772C19